MPGGRTPTTNNVKTLDTEGHSVMNDAVKAFEPDRAIENAVRDDLAAAFDPQQPHIPDELRKCGAVVDNAIEYMVGKDLPPEMVASALLAGSLGILARTSDAATMVRMLQTAIFSIQNGELTPPDDARTP